MMSGIEAMLFDRPVKGAIGWHLFADHTDIDTAAELMLKVQAVSYVQMSDDQKIEVLSATTDTTQTVTIYGIDSAGNRASEEIALDGTTPVVGAITWSFYEGAYLDKECAGAIVIQKEDNTDISGITIGDLTDYVVQHFNGKCDSYITAFGAGVSDNAVDTVTFDIRWYPDDADCRDAGTGFIILDRIVAHAATVATAVSPSIIHNFPLPIKCPAGGWIAVYGLGGQNNSLGHTMLQGFDMEST